MTNKISALFVNILCFFAALGIYSLVFFLPLPPQVNFKGIQIVDEAIILANCVLIFLAFKKNGPAWKALALVLTLTIFTLPLLRMWESAESNYNTVLGLLPWSDAAGYYADAITLLQGGLYSPFSGHRPFFSSFLAVLLSITQGSISISLIILTVINGISVFLFISEIRHHFGPAVGVVMLLILQFFYRQSAGALMTEQLGFPLGLIAFSTILHATQKVNKWYFGIGMFLFAISLFTRAGAFFILVTLLLFGIVLFSENKRSPAKNSIWLFIALLAGWGVNFWLGQLVSSPGTAPMGNFSYTLYGQAVGGKGWTQVFIDHPELGQTPDAEQAKIIYGLALNEFFRNPLTLIKAFLTAWKDFFIPNNFAVFSFIQPGDKYSSLIIQILLSIFLFIGILECWKRRKQNIYLLLLAAFGGIFLSIPFVPPSESSYMRVYAATISIPALIACIGISKIIHSQQKSIPTNASVVQSESSWLSTSLGLITIFITVVGSLVIRSIIIHPGSQQTPMSCSNESVPLQFKLVPGSFLSIVTNETNQKTFIPNVSARDFRKSLRAFPGIYSDFSIPLIEAVTPPALFTYTRNQLTGDFVWLIVPPGLVNHIGEIIPACGKTISQESSVIEIQSVYTSP